MFNVETHTAAAVDALRKTANAFDKAGSNLDHAMTAVFVAYLAADHGLTAKTVSKTVADKCPQAKVPGPVAARKSRNTTYFGDSTNLAALRAALPNPEAMEPGAFQAAVIQYVKGLNIRQWLADKTASKAKAQISTQTAIAAAQREPGEDEVATPPLNAGFDPVLSATTSINKSIDALIDMVTSGGEYVDDANAALTNALTYLTKRVNDLLPVEEVKAA